jgi:hypothetical protein
VAPADEEPARRIAVFAPTQRASGDAPAIERFRPLASVDALAPS